MMAVAGVRLVKYDAACRALAEAKRVDDVKAIHDEAKARAAYARVAKDTRMRDAAESIRFRAERRLGELMALQAKTVGKAKNRPGPGRGKAGVSATPAFNGPPTLAEAGIDKNLAKRARKAATMGEQEFEATADAIKAGEVNGGAARSRPKRRPAQHKSTWVDPGDDNESPDDEIEDRKNLVASFLIRADACKSYAIFSGDHATAAMVKAARAVAERWAAIADKLEGLL